VNEAVVSVSEDAPLWRRLLNFPLIAMVIAVALFILASFVAQEVGKLLPPMPMNVAAVAKAVIAIALELGVYKFVVIRLGDRPRDDLKIEGASTGVAKGLLIGCLLFSALVGIASLAGAYRIVGAGDTSELVKDLAGMAIASAFMEELLFRGILFRWIEAFGGSWAALAVTSALFGLGHLPNPNATWVSSLAITVEAGIMLGGAYMLTRSLWLAMGLHAAWNFTQGFVFGVPVSGENVHGLVQAKLSGPVLLSGGAFGLEASIIAVLLCVPVGVAMIVLAVRRGRVVDPWWSGRR
jgi:uncharacterized protein